MAFTCKNCQRVGLSDLADFGESLSVISFNIDVTNLNQEGIDPVQPVIPVKEKYTKVHWDGSIHCVIL